MGKKLILAILLVATVFLTVGCPFLSSSAHTRAHSKAIDSNLVEIHYFMDRYFWLYDWDDPYVN